MGRESRFSPQICVAVCLTSHSLGSFTRPGASQCQEKQYDMSGCEGADEQRFIQPFSQKSRTPTVAKEFQIGLCGVVEAQIGLCGVVEADLELFCNYSAFSL